MNEIKIIIVEDEIITATDLKETLEKSGHKVIALARSHAEAIAAIEKQTPELMIVDIGLKHSAFDGIEIAIEVSKNYAIPFVFLTGHDEIQTFQRAKSANPAAYLLKPFRHKELVFQVELAYAHYLANKKDDNNPSTAENVYLPINKMLHQKISKSEVMFMEAKRSCVWVHVKGKTKHYEFTMNIGHLAQYFNTNNFYQISRSLIINLDYLDTITADNLTLKFYEGDIPIPNNKKGELMKKLAVIKTP
jgi:DNA-binding LytR/AlgR family response regulator